MKLIIGASKSNTIGSWLIRKWLKTSYSHIYVKWYLKTQEIYIIYHASSKMVHFKSDENFKKSNFIVKELEFDIPDDVFKKFSKKCIDLAGEPYSYLTLLQILLCDLFNLKNHFNLNGYICSELLGELLEEAGIVFDKPKYLITPKDIMEKIQ